MGQKSVKSSVCNLISRHYIIPENGAKVSKIKCLQPNQQTLIINTLAHMQSLEMLGINLFHIQLRLKDLEPQKRKVVYSILQVYQLQSILKKINMELALLTDLDYILRQVVVKKRVIILKFLRKR